MILGKPILNYIREEPAKPAATPASGAADAAGAANAVDTYLKQYPHGVPLGRALVGLGSGFGVGLEKGTNLGLGTGLNLGLGALTLGKPQQIAPKIEFHPVIASRIAAGASGESSLPGTSWLNRPLLGNAVGTPLAPGAAAPGFGLDPTTDILSALSALAQARSAGEKVWCGVDLVDAFPDLPHGVEIAVHALGVMRFTPGVIQAFQKRGCVAEKSMALAQLAGSVASLITDCPGLEAGRPAAEIFAIVVKIGEAVCTVPYKPLPVTLPVKA